MAPSQHPETMAKPPASIQCGASRNSYRAWQATAPEGNVEINGVLFEDSSASLPSSASEQAGREGVAASMWYLWQANGRTTTRAHCGIEQWCAYAN